MGFLGSKRGLTQNLDRIASESLNFKDAYTNAFFTTPSHMTVFTSLYPTTHRVESSGIKVPRLEKSEGPAIPLRADFLTMAELLKSENYQTVWAAPLNFKFFSFEDGFGRGFQKFMTSPFTRGLHFPINQPWDLDLKKLQEATRTEAGKPLFLFLHSYITHLPYVLGPETEDNFAVPYLPSRLLGGAKMIMDRNPQTVFPKYEQKHFNLSKAIHDCLDFENMQPCFDNHVPKENFIHRIGQWQLRVASNVYRRKEDLRFYDEMRRYEEAYDYGVAKMDEQVGRLWGFLEQEGLLQNSVVVIISDHGEEIFDHGQGNHSSFYEHTARVPWLIYVPKSGGKEYTGLVSLVDVLPTVFEILGLKSPDQTQGVSVFSHLNQDYVFGASLGVSYVRGNEWKLIHGDHGQIELYHLGTDPFEKRNLIELRLPFVQNKAKELERVMSDFKTRQIF